MSTLEVITTPILDIAPHPNADRLEIARVLGWSCVVPRERYSPGDVVVYIPVDAVLPVELSDRLGITQYLSKGRVRAAKLRGVVSFGLVMQNEGWEVGTILNDELGITKYEPPIKVTAGDVLPPHPRLLSYTNIENIKNHPDIFLPGEEVVVTEKIHGTNCVHALIIEDDGAEVFMAASHNHRRAESETSTYWRTFDENTRAMLREAAIGHRSAIVYKEVYGSKIQNLSYGHGKGTISDAAFDLRVDGQFIDYDNFRALAERHDVPVVPLLTRGPFDREALDALVNGDGVKTVLGEGKHIMEGVVIKPVKERYNDFTGRTILKWISDAFALDKNATDFH